MANQDEANSSPNAGVDGQANSSPNAGVDIAKLAKHITEELTYYTALNENKNREPKPFAIHEIELHIKSNDTKMYEPTKLSLGPYHHGIEASKAFEEYKWKCFDYLAMLRQDKETKYSREKTLEKYLDSMDQCIEQMAKNIYSEEITMDQRSFSQMLLIDGCFIIAQVLGFEQTKQQCVPLFIKSWCNPYVARDMLLLENQVPFFTIEKIYELIFGENTSGSLRERVITFMEQRMIDSYLTYEPQRSELKDFHHLLHLCLVCLRPVEEHKKRYLKRNNRYENMHPTRWRRATMYNEVGIGICKKKFDEENPHSISDITFHKNVIQIPQFHIDSNTGTLFKNLIALEKSCPKYGNNFTTYVIFLTQIMSMPSDISYMIENEIISHSLISDEKVFELFSSLRENVKFDLSENYYLEHMNRAVEESYQKGLKRWVVRTGLTQLPNPRYRFFMVLAFIYVVFEVLRTFFAAKSYYNLR